MLKVGYIVKLKSGGPAMTVEKVRANKAVCVWFREERLKTAIFRADTLEVIEGHAEKLPKIEKADKADVKAKPAK